MKFRVAIAAALALSATPALADITYTQGLGTTIFDFTCFTTKHCTSHVIINSAGTEILTTAAPGIVSGSGTAGTAASGVVTVQGIASMTALKVDGTGGTFPVSGTVTANIGTAGTLATAAKQPALGTAGVSSADVISVQGIASGTALRVDGSAVTQPISGGLSDGTNTAKVLAASTQAAATDKSLVVQINPNQPAMTTAQPGQFVSLGPVGSGTAVDQSSGNKSAGSQRVVIATDDVAHPTWGHGATAASVPANGTMAGARAQNAEASAVTNGQLVAAAADLVGKLIVLPYANPENFVSGVITSAMTGTTSTSLVAAPAGSLRNYITSCTFSNSHATVGTDMILQDGNGGTTIWNAPAAAVYGGTQLIFPTPLRQPTAATALYVANVTTGSNTKAACSGYKGL